MHATELQALVNAARQLGETCVVTKCPDGTIVEMYFDRPAPLPAHYESAPSRPSLIQALARRFRPTAPTANN